MTTAIAEATVELAALQWLRDLGYEVAHGPDLAPGGPHAERETYGDVVLVDRLRPALARLNPTLPPDVIDEAVRRVLRRETPNLAENNRRFHQLVTEGVPVEVRRPDGRIAGETVRLFDFNDPSRNDWLAVNQFEVSERVSQDHAAPTLRRPDIVIFVNGLPLAVIELKDPTDPQATLRKAFQQLQTYKLDLPGLMTYNELLVIGDGPSARLGSLTADWDRFMPWRTVDGEEIIALRDPDLAVVEPDHDPSTFRELEVLIRGVFAPARLLDLVRYFIVFEADGATITKKIAAYHQYHAANRAVQATVQAAQPNGSRKVGVVWHTQGSGKSLTMAFYAGKIVQQPELANPTIVVLTDRNDLDDQLFGTFAASKDLLRQVPVQAESREALKDLLQVASGGVVFTTVQKFLPAPGEAYPQLSERRNIVFIADEAHRSQYGFTPRLVKDEDSGAAYLAYGFAKHMRDALPNASFIAFTGTPIAHDDHDTRRVFGSYLDVYDIQRSVEDGATVPIYYESRLADLELDEAERPRIDPDFDEVTEGMEVESREQLKTRWSRLEAIVGSDRRIRQIARDIVAHFERRLEAMDGKGMIVCMSRRIAVRLHDEIVALRPGWRADADDQGRLKVVMTGSASDPLEWQPHIRNTARRRALGNRFKDPKDPFKLVIVRDMWLTGFDAPSLHSMYVDKPMRGHTLMQAIARVNRVFGDKPGGLVVDYIGLAPFLQAALRDYTEAGSTDPTHVQAEAVRLMREKYEVLAALFHGFNYRAFPAADPGHKLALVADGLQHVLKQPDGKDRFLRAAAELSRAYALAVPHPDALAIRDDVAFFQTLRATLAKTTVVEGRSADDLSPALQQLVAKAVAPVGVVDIFASMGLSRPDISILSDEFLAEVQGLPQRDLSVELLRRLLNDEIIARSRRNIVQARSFEGLLNDAINRYRNRTLETAEVMAELVAIAKNMRAAQSRGAKLNLSDEELAFYDALETNDSAIQALGDELLRAIAREITDSLRQNATLDWQIKENVRARLRSLVKRTLRRYGYPPDKQQKAVDTVLEQAEAFAAEWAA